MLIYKHDKGVGMVIEDDKAWLGNRFLIKKIHKAKIFYWMLFIKLYYGKQTLSVFFYILADAVWHLAPI